MATHIFRISLRPKLFRDIEIDSRKSLHELASGIVDAFDFDFDHAFGFYSKLTGPYHQSPEKYELFADLGRRRQRRRQRAGHHGGPGLSGGWQENAFSCSITATNGASRSS